MNRHVLRIAAVVLLSSVPVVLGVPASPHPYQVTQPDGTVVTLHIRGDEHFHWEEDINGYTVVRNAAGAYVYAALANTGQLAPTKHVVGRTDPAAVGLTPRILPPLKFRTAARAEALARAAQPAERARAVPPIGTVKNLVVLCKFSDHVLGTHTRARGDYDVLFNTVGGDPTLAPTGSVRDCFTENSYGQMTLDSTVPEWVTLPQTEAYYADGQYGSGTYPQNSAGMVEDALDLLDATLDFGDFDTDDNGYVDSIGIIHSGYDAAAGAGPNSIWSHMGALSSIPGGQWTSSDVNGVGEYVKVYFYHTEPALRGTSGTEMVRIGVFVHETGHFFDLPDLYDTTYAGSGIGSYGMMANSWGFDGSSMYPPHLSAWSKVFLGWVTPTVISTPGVYTAPQVQTTPTVFHIDLNYPNGEYLLVENRQPVGFDSQMPQGGLCIWHIDEIKPGNTDPGYPGQPGWPANNNHYMVALLQADGWYDLEHGYGRGDAGDVYHAAGVSAIGELTVPNTDAYQLGNIFATHNAITNITAAGASMDFTYNGFLDCNHNGTPDNEDISTGPSLDCQPNGIPDECETDCQPNGVPDECDITDETSDDCNTNGVPDSCETAAGGILINEDFEGGLPGGWSASGIMQITGLCGLADPDCGGTMWAYAGDTASCTYDDSEIGDLIAPPVSLGYGTSELRFCSRVDTEVDFDFTNVLVNGQLIWQDSGNSGGWVEEVLDLSSFAGQTVTINFQFVSDGAVSGMLGWQVDNVSVTTEDLDTDDNGIPDECEGPRDCNNNEVNDSEDIATDTSKDCNTNGIPDECEIDENSSAPGGSHYCDPLSPPAGLLECDPDCNGNGVPDECDIADCSGDPACADCDGNSIPDGCDIAGGAPDCNTNGTPDECDVADCSGDPACDDCDGNTIPDGCDITGGAPDCNTNGTPDECDITDCSGDPACDDCDGNTIPDGCDITGGEPDNNGNGIPDVCDAAPPVLPSDPQHQAPKNRYISIDPTTSGANVIAIRVDLTSMRRCTGDNRRACISDADCPGVCSHNPDLQCESDAICGGTNTCMPTSPCAEHSSVGAVTKWLDEPYPNTCVPLNDCAGQWFASLFDAPLYRIWTEDVVHVTDCEIVPCVTYNFRATVDSINFSDPLTIGTITKPNVHFADCVGPVVAGAYTPADGFTNVTDVQAYLIANQGGATAPHTTWIDLHSGSIPVVPQQILNVGDLQTIKFGFLGQTYVETPGQENPGDCP